MVKEEKLELLLIFLKKFSINKSDSKKRDKLVPIRGTLSIRKAKKLLNYKSKYPLEKGYQKYIFGIETFLKIYDKK